MTETQPLFEAATPEGGVLRLMRWPEGYVLWHHGEIVWRSWEAASQTVTLKLRIEAGPAAEALDAFRADVERRIAAGARSSSHRFAL